MSGTNADHVEDVLHIEEECIRYDTCSLAESRCVLIISRLSAQVHHLQRQIDQTQASAQAREDELLSEIEALRLKLRQLSPVSHPVGFDYRKAYITLQSYHPDFFDASNADESMDLATPLQPTTILPRSNASTAPDPVDPSLIPLPFSPERTSSPPSSSPGSFAQCDLQRVQEALTTARDNLARKESVLARLRTDVEGLRQQIPLSGPSTRHQG